jgi:hypothetical protein
MKLNLPILDSLRNSRNILIAGAGGGFDVFSGLPLYFALREMGKSVHLANYSFSEFAIVQAVSQPQVLIDGLLLGAHGAIQINLPYYPEGYLVRWFREARGEDVTVWMFARTGVAPLIQGYSRLVKHLNIDAIVLVDGGVDSIMRGDEVGSGTLVEDSITLAAVDEIDVPVKLLACIGFGTEVEEAVCHYNALENIAALAKAGGFLGSCALTPQMEVFQLFESACRYVWEQPNHQKSHISTRIIPAVKGEFGNYHLYSSDYSSVFISPLMSLYWFFDARTVIARNLLIPRISSTITTTQAIMICAALKQEVLQRPRREIPY